MTRAATCSKMSVPSTETTPPSFSLVLMSPQPSALSLCHTGKVNAHPTSLFLRYERLTFKASFSLLEYFVNVCHAAKANLRRPRFTTLWNLSTAAYMLKKIYKCIYFQKEKCSTILNFDKCRSKL